MEANARRIASLKAEEALDKICELFEAADGDFVSAFARITQALFDSERLSLDELANRRAANLKRAQACEAQAMIQLEAYKRASRRSGHRSLQVYSIPLARPSQPQRIHIRFVENVTLDTLHSKPLVVFSGLYVIPPTPPIIERVLAPIESADGTEHPPDASTRSVPYLRVIGSHGSASDQFSYLWGIAYNPQTSEIFVADNGNQRIQVLNKKGDFLRLFGTYGTENGEFGNPTGLALSSDGQCLAVTEWENRRVQWLRTDGTFLNITPRDMFARPWYVTVDTSDRFYVSDMEGNSVFRFSKDGELECKWNGGEEHPVGAVMAIVAIESRSPGMNNQTEIFTMCQGATEIKVYSPDGVWIRSISVRASHSEVFLARGPNNGIVLSEKGTNVVRFFDNAGTLLGTFSVNGVTGVTFDDDGNFWALSWADYHLYGW